MNEAGLILEPLLYRQSFQIETIAASRAEHCFCRRRILRSFSRGPPTWSIIEHFNGYPLRVDAKADEHVGGEFARGGQVCLITDLSRQLNFIVAHREEIGGDVVADLVHERCGNNCRVMSAVDTDERAFFQAGILAEIEAHDGKAGGPRHVGDLKVGTEFECPSREFFGGAEPDWTSVEMRPGLARPLADNLAYFGAAKACAHSTSVVNAPEARNFIRSGGRCSHTDA